MAMFTIMFRNYLKIWISTTRTEYFFNGYRFNGKFTFSWVHYYVWIQVNYQRENYLKARSLRLYVEFCWPFKYPHLLESCPILFSNVLVNILGDKLDSIRWLTTDDFTCCSGILLTIFTKIVINSPNVYNRKFFPSVLEIQICLLSINYGCVCTQDSVRYLSVSSFNFLSSFFFFYFSDSDVFLIFQVHYVSMLDLQFVNQPAILYFQRYQLTAAYLAL